MNDASMPQVFCNTYEGQLDSIADLPKTATIGTMYQIGEETWVWSTSGHWVCMMAIETDTVINIERAISAFEGVLIVFRRPGYDRMTKGYTFAQPVHDSEPVDVLRKRLADTWLNCEFEIMDGRSRWDHTLCKTMGQLRNSYLMSRSPE